MQTLVVVTHTASDVVFLKSDGLVVSRAEPVEFLGIGENSLIRYLTEAAKPESLTICEAGAFAVAIVWAAKEYFPQYAAEKQT